MNYLKFKFVILALVTQGAAYAKSYRGEVSSNSFMVHYQNQQTLINHQEASTDSGFTSLAEETKIPVHGIQLEASHEFFASYLFSLTVSARYGKNTGSLKKTNDTTGLSFEEEVSGQMYGAGGSLNLNISAFDMKVQPFVGFYSLTHKNTYKLKYSPISDTSTTTDLKYESELQVQQISLGVRFIDYYHGLLSHFSADYISGDSPTLDISSNLDNLSNTATPERREYAFTIGCGVLF